MEINGVGQGDTGPTREFILAARRMIPYVSLRDITMAWTSSHGQGDSISNGLNWLLENDDEGEEEALPAAKAGPLPKAGFRDPSDLNLINPLLNLPRNQNFVRYPVASGSGSNVNGNAVASGSGKTPVAMKSNVIELGDSSDEEVSWGVVKKKKKGVRGGINRKEPVPVKRPFEIISLSDSEDELPDLAQYGKGKNKPFLKRPSPPIPPFIVPAIIPPLPLAPVQQKGILKSPIKVAVPVIVSPIIAPIAPQPIIASVPPKVVVPPPPVPAAVALTQENINLVSVLSIIHDVEPQHVLKLLRDPRYGNKVEHVLEILFSGPYPKIEVVSGSKGQKRAVDQETVVVEKNWLDGKEELGFVYREASLNQLCLDFTSVPKAILRKTWIQHSFRYSPSYLSMQKELISSAADRGWKTLTGMRNNGKGKGREESCPELEQEVTWLMNKIDKDMNSEMELAAEIKKSEDEIARGEFFECGCCFSDTGFSQCVTCTDGDSFCKECFINNAGTQVGLRQYIIPCMADGCEATFGESELAKFLSANTLSALHKIKQEREIDGAQITGLAKCPFCPFACIIENEQERLFVCQREECGIVSCRQCEKPDHLPKTCAEMSDDKKIDCLHKIEEAMSESLIRRCPNPTCKNPFIKEDGCNKMTCMSCRTMSCYICSAVVTGYNHFINAGSNATSTDKGAKCELWDDSKKNEFDRVEAARAEAAAKVVKDNPAVGAEDLKALALAAPPPPPANIAAHMAIHGGAPRVVVPPRHRARFANPPLPLPLPLPVIRQPPLPLPIHGRHLPVHERIWQDAILQQQQANLQIQQAALAEHQAMLQRQQFELQRQQQQQILEHQLRQQQLNAVHRAEQEAARRREIVRVEAAQRKAQKARVAEAEKVRAARRKSEADRDAKRARLVKR